MSSTYQTATTAVRFQNNQDQDFAKTLNARVAEYFKVNNRKKYANSEMVLKTIAMFSLYFIPYISLFYVTNIWLLYCLFFIMGIGTAGLGLSVMHDALHGGYSNKPWVNKLMGYTLNLIGGNPTNWKIQHNVFHHSFTGELGYEMYVPSAYARGLYDYLLDVGDSLGIRPFGIRALVSLGMEKSFGIWSREFTPDFTPAMCGMGRFVDYDKADFVGREAALADRDAKHEHKLVALEIDSIDADVWGYEPIWHKDDYAGFVTSGAYGHTVGKSLAMAYVRTPYLGAANGELSVHVVDQRRPASILAEPPHDPSGSRMRS